VLGHPQRHFPTIHIGGTNGKGSTQALVAAALREAGYRVGQTPKPHLVSYRERVLVDGAPIAVGDFISIVGEVLDAADAVAGRHGPPTEFEVLTAAAFAHFADVAVDVAVVEVGVLGKWDATNVVDAQVAVITNIGMDHNEFAGPTKAHIAAEKAGIIKPRSAVIVGETDPALVPFFADIPLRSGYVGESHFDVEENQLALGGRALDLRTPTTIYSDVFVPLHGRHQGDNAAVALAAVEAFFASPVADDIVRDGFAEVRMPGRFEVLGHQPLVIVDGAHNPPGADSCAEVFFDDFVPAGRRILVCGCLRGRDPKEMLAAFRADEFDFVLTCTAPTPRGMPSGDVAAAARALGCDQVIECDTVPEACDRAIRIASADDAVLVTGSLYVVGAARPHLKRII